MTATRGLVLRQFIILMAVGTLTESTPTSEPHPIGVGVTVEARIFFDKTINFSATNENRPFEEFKKIFLEVQKEFRNNKIMVKFVVKSAKANDSFSVPFVNMTKAVDGEKTLENVKAFGMARSAPNNTIFYYFTSYTILKESGQKHENDQVPVQLFDIETRRTFCSENVSAAVVYFETATSYDFPARAAALIFGSTRYTSFQRTDRQYMNESFSRCGKHTVTST
ncbi:uncharacterized protein [Dermacentor andersoni]|uniref:uncharacterized protein isoform X1 n=1 Tax=Dermacentor andersoni TaxID=34620 RepID=UPI002416901D|nr:uncharacterized protein LOC126543558 isoform X1 [Dermacentor andersoni]